MNLHNRHANKVCSQKLSTWIGTLHFRAVTFQFNKKKIIA